MKLREIMSQSLEVISKDASLTEAANIMARMDIGFLPVLDGQEIAGTITDRDIIIRAVAAGHDPTSTRVGTIMTKGAVILSPDDDIEKAASQMEDRQIRRIIVRAGDGAYVGVVSLGDLAKRTNDPQLSGETLEKVCEPAAGC